MKFQQSSAVYSSHNGSPTLPQENDTGFSSIEIQSQDIKFVSQEETFVVNNYSLNSELNEKEAIDEETARIISKANYGSFI